MTLRASGSSTITLGLLSIPVRIYPATTRDDGPSFHLLHAKCGARLKQEYRCPVCEKAVDKEEIARGYEHQKDHHVVLSDDELAALEAHSDAIAIIGFVKQDEVPQLFKERMYFLGPDKGGSRGYFVFAQALARTKRAALVRYAARGKEHVGLVVPHKGGLAIHQLHWADHVRGMEDLGLEPEKVDAQELKLAMRLIESKVVVFEPLKDDAHARLDELVTKKLAGGKTVTVHPGAAQGPAQVIDLMEALKASLAAAGDKTGGVKRSRVRGARG